MSRRTAAGLALSVLLLLLLSAGCGGEGRLASSGVVGLKGKTIGVASLSDVSTLETRYVLQKGYGLDTSQSGSTVKFAEAPPESLAIELQSGQIDAAVFSQAGAFRLLNDARFRVLSHVSQEMRKLSGGPVASSVLVTYPDVAQQKSAALEALHRLLAESVAYEQANEGAVLHAVAAQTRQDQALLRWQAAHQELRLGDLSQETQERLLRTWQAASALGDIDHLPDLATVLFDPKQKDQTALPGGRVTVTLALLDEPIRRAALYAIEEGLVTSTSIDLNITYLPPSAIAEAATTKQYDVVEALPLIVPASARQAVGFIVLSAGVDDLDSTLLFVKNTSSPRETSGKN